MDLRNSIFKKHCTEHVQFASTICEFFKFNLAITNWYTRGFNVPVFVKRISQIGSAKGERSYGMECNLVSDTTRGQMHRRLPFTETALLMYSRRSSGASDLELHSPTDSAWGRIRKAAGYWCLASSKSQRLLLLGWPRMKTGPASAARKGRSCLHPTACLRGLPLGSMERVSTHSNPAFSWHAVGSINVWSRRYVLISAGVLIIWKEAPNRWMTRQLSIAGTGEMARMCSSTSTRVPAWLEITSLLALAMVDPQFPSQDVLPTPMRSG